MYRRSKSTAAADLPCLEPLEHRQLLHAGEPEAIFRIDAGAAAPYTDALGHTWSADTGFSGGTTSSNLYSVANTGEDPLYATRRWGAMRYGLAAPNGDYTLRLHFAEPVMWKAGQRVFNVFAEGKQVLANLDLFAQAGPKAALVKTIPISIADGKLDLSFAAVVENPIISAIELLPVETPPPPEAQGAVRINSAGSAYMDAQGQSWLADTGFSGGTVSNSAYGVAGTGDDYLYYTRRYGNFGYSRAVASGDYTLRLHFAEPVMWKAGQRVFNVEAEGRTVLSNVDLFAQAGSRTALVKSIPITISDGRLDLGFRGVVENAIVSAIELVPRTTPEPPTPPPAGNQIAWSSVAPSPIWRAESQGAAVDNKLYVFGGYSASGGQPTGASTRSDVYNPATNAWSQIAPLRSPVTHAAVAVDGRDIYLAGGYTYLGGVWYNQSFATAQVWKYHIDSNSWSAMPALPEARGSGGMVRLGRELHFFGGVDAGRIERGSHWVLNLENPAAGWSAAAPMRTPRSHMAGVELGGRIYAIGGETNTGGNPLTSSLVEVYDPASGSWSTAAPLPLSRAHIAAGTVIWNGRIVVLGGDHLNEQPTANIDVYDPASNEWAAMTPLPAPRHSGVAAVINGKFYYTTGGSTATWAGTA